MGAKISCPHCGLVQGVNFEGVSGGFAMFRCELVICEEFFTDDDTHVHVGSVTLDTTSYLFGAGLITFDEDNIMQEVEPQEDED